ncbi:SN2 [Linum grandiflorum]
MAISRFIVFVSLLLLSFGLIHHLANAAYQNQPSVAPNYPPPKIDCGTACTARCQLSSRPNLCNRACTTCCLRCSCVPPGTAGNYDQCPCYAALTTHGAARKCP